MIGRRIQHYEITEKLGEGGMGVVYKARDTRLDRTVALKFLSPEVTGDPAEQERLLNEARSAAAVNHPNICTIYEINEAENQTFMAMEYIEGATLRDRVLSGQIELADSLRYIIQIASGLKSLHESGIIHRDMKSSNIMINRAGQAVIMDFGLARQTGQNQGDRKLSSRGTSAYMSPEQARGEGVDERTDIWSLGVVLYEMLTGHLPFRGDYEQAVIYSILNEKPRPVSDLRGGVPEDITGIVECCLEKDPNTRYQTLDEAIAAVRAALDNLTGGRRIPAKPGRRRNLVAVPIAAAVVIAALFGAYNLFQVDEAGSEVQIPIAVADFDNGTGEPSLDGLSGMLATALDQSRRLSVVSRTRMFDIIKTLDRDAPARIDEATGQQVCIAAGIDHLVIPTINKFGNLYTIDLKVLDIRSNRYVFTGKRESEGQENIPRMIDEIARSIRLDLAEPPEIIEATPVAQMTTGHLDAYQAYFDGEEHLRRLELKEASEEFAKAAEIDSAFALAHYRLAYISWWSQQAQEDAEKHIAVAVEDLERIPHRERFLVRALHTAIEEGFEAQVPVLKEMQLVYPDDKEMLFALGDAAFHSNEIDTARVYFERVVEIDPEFERALQHLTWTYLNLHDYARAEALATQWVNVHGTGEAYQNLARAQFRRGDSEAALATAARAKKLGTEDDATAAWVAELYLSQGDREAALEYLETSRKSENKVKSIRASRSLAASVYPYLGRYGDALAVLDEGFEFYTEEKSDTTMAILALMDKASIYYWGWQDTDRMLATAEATLEYPEEYLKYGYWGRLASMYMLAGDSTQAGELLREKVKFHGDIDRLAYDIFFLGTSGRCDEARVMLANEPTLKDERQSGLRDRLNFLVGMCQLKNGDYAGAIQSLEPVANEKLVTFEIMPMLAPACFMLGRAYEEQGRLADAKRCYERVLSIYSDADPDIRVLLETRERMAHITATGNM